MSNRIQQESSELFSKLGSRIIGFAFDSAKDLFKYVVLKKAELFKLENPLKNLTAKEISENVKKSDRKPNFKDITLDDTDLKGFDKYAKKYGFEYAIKRDFSVDPPVNVIFFKAEDLPKVEKALKEMINEREVNQAKESIRKRLKVKQLEAKDHNKENSQDRHKSQEQSL